MVAPSEAPVFVPAERPGVAVATDGTLAAIVDAPRVVVLEIPGAAPFAEISIPTKVLSTEIGWVGAPPRLVLLSRYEAHSTVQLIDPYGPRVIAELRLESPMKLLATVGAHALVVSSTAATILTAMETGITQHPFPARTVPTAAGGAAGNFVIALGGSIEEWDPAARMPMRRLRLARPAVITGIGGSDRVVWLTTLQDPGRLDVIPLVDRGQPKSHDLPELIAHAVGHPRSDLVVCVGAKTGTLFVVDADGRAKLRTLTPAGIDRSEAAALVIGRMTGVLVAQATRPVVLVGLDPPTPVAPVVSEAKAKAPVEPRPIRKTMPPPPPPSSKTQLGDPVEVVGSANAAPAEARPVRKTVPPPPPPSSKTPLVDPAEIPEPPPVAEPAPPPTSRKSTLDDFLESFAGGEVAPGRRAETFGSIDVDIDDEVDAEVAPSEPAPSEPSAKAPAAPTPASPHAAAPGAKAAAAPTPASAPAPTPASPSAPSAKAPALTPASPHAASPASSAKAPAVPTPASPHAAPGAKAPPPQPTAPPITSTLYGDLDQRRATAPPLTSTLYGEPDEPRTSALAPASTQYGDPEDLRTSAPAPSSTQYGDPEDLRTSALASSSTLYGEPDDPRASARAFSSTLYGDPDDPPVRSPGAGRSTVYEPETGESASARLSAWREKMRQAQARSEYLTPLPSVDREPSWRDDVVLWTRAVFSSIERSVPAAPPIDLLAGRFDLPDELVPALVLLYGAHLAGERGAAPVDVARVLGRRWDEALGTGQLAERGLALYVDSRVRLAGPLQRALDEVSVTTGTLVGEGGSISLLGPCVVVDAGPRLAFVASRCLSRVGGAILAARDDVDPGELFIEARARGAAPMLRVAAGDIVELGTDPAVLVVSDESIADQLGVPRLF